MYGPNNFAFEIDGGAVDLTLAPGDYQLVSTDYLPSGFFPCDTNPPICTQTFPTELSLHAGFTPLAAVPEPSSVVVILGSLVALTFVARRRSQG